MLCEIMIDPSFPMTSAIRNEIVSRLDIDFLRGVLASYRELYLEHLYVCMADATCNESHIRFPTSMKLLWESLEWLYRHICKHCRGLGIRHLRNKYVDVVASYLSYCKKENGKYRKRTIKWHIKWLYSTIFICYVFCRGYLLNIPIYSSPTFQGLLDVFCYGFSHHFGKLFHRYFADAFYTFEFP